MKNVIRAVLFARKAHEGQKRKYGSEDYIIHPMSVALMLTHYYDDDDMIVAGVLHDIIEDTSYTFDDIVLEFGISVANLVLGMTKTYSRNASPEEKTISDLKRFSDSVDQQVLDLELVDIFVNLSDYMSAPVSFVRKFVKNKKRVVELIAEKRCIDRNLLNEVKALIKTVEAYLKQQ
jgi:(p)ppGpp synthase/HD superfamily hydrolase